MSEMKNNNNDSQDTENEDSESSDGNKITFNVVIRELESDEELNVDNSLPQFILDEGFAMFDCIGRGHFADVFRAKWNQMPDKDIACKKIVMEEVEQDWKEECLHREIRTMKKLNHKNIVKFYKVFKTRRFVFIFMEFAENGTIKGRLEAYEHPYKESAAKNLFRQMVDGLVYMHDQNIAHRDLKLENFLLNSQYEVLISDFGFACFTIDRKTQKPVLEHMTCGSPSYMAPEVQNASTDSPYDPKMADIYSLGVCLFEMINFDKPFSQELTIDSDHMTILYDYKMKRTYRFHSKLEPLLSSEIKDLINKLLEPNPKKRITGKAVRNHSTLKQTIY